MNRPIILRDKAEEDIRDTYDYLEMDQPGLGDQFQRQLNDVLELIEHFPEMYGVIWQDVRAAQLQRMRNHLVYYVVFADRIEVLAVLRGSRDAFTWQSRR